VRLAICILLGIALVPAAASAPDRSGTNIRPRTVRWQVTLSVTDGHHALTRLASLSPPNTTGSGTVASSWTARFRVRVTIDGRNVNFAGASAYQVTGSASGEYHGSYPKGGGTVSYSCPVGPLSPGQLETQFRLRAYGRTNTQLFMTWYPLHEPAALPPVTCTGGPVDSGVTKVFNYGLFAGLSTDCLAAHPGPAARKLTGTRAFSYSKRFTWSATSAHGHDKYCNGFGGPIASDTSGTIRMSFRRL
jgi:hypothetical protein